MTTAIKALLQHPIAYNPVVAKATGSVKLTVLWCQIHYWTDKAHDPEGWVYKTRDQVYAETGLSRKEQETARELAERLGVMQTQVRGTPPTVHFRVDEERMVQVIEEWMAKNPEESGPSKDRKGRPETSFDWIRSVPDADADELAKAFGTTREFVIQRAEDVRDYCEAKGKRYSNYRAALRNFIKGHRGPRPTSAKPAPPQPKAQAWESESSRDSRDRSPEEQRAYEARIREVRETIKKKMSMK